MSLLALTCVSFFFWGCSSRLVELEEKIVEDVTDDIIEDVEEYIKPHHHQKH